MTTQEHILVIRLGALGDIILSTAAFAAIRAHHPHAHITLLTSKPFAKLLAASPYFDEVQLDPRAKWWKLGAWMDVAKILRARACSRVYDLQTSKRSTLYYKLLRSPKPAFSGLAKGCAFEHNTPQRKTLHTLDRQQEQLAIAGIHYTPRPDTTWMTGDISSLHLPARYALIAAGGSAHRPEKRWTVEGFAALCAWLIERGIAPVLLGTAAESDVLDAIAQHVNQPQLLNLCNRTSFGDMVEMAKHAAVAVGNDTGPMHIIAASGCPSLVVFSHASNPDLCAPRGEHVRTLRKPTLDALTAQEVIEVIEKLTR